MVAKKAHPQISLFESKLSALLVVSKFSCTSFFNEGSCLVFILAFFLICELLALIFISARLTKYWLISPAVMMSAYFLFVKYPGFFIAEGYETKVTALFAHILWFLSVIFALFLIKPIGNNKSLIHLKNKVVRGNKKIFLFFVFLSVPSVIITFYMFDRVPLFVGLSSLIGFDSDISMHAARRMNTLQHRSGDTIYFGQGYFRIIYTVVSPVFLVALLVYSRVAKGIESNRSIALMMFFLVFAGALNGQIWMSAQLLLFFFMAYYYLLIIDGRGVREISIICKGVLSYAFLLAFVFLYRYLQFIQGRHFDNFFLDTLIRIYSFGSIDLFGIFPSQEPFRYGSTWLNDFKGLLPGSIQSFAYEVHYLVHGGAWGFTLSPGIVASSFVNFGYLGVFFVGLIFTTIFTKIFMRLIESASSIRIAIAIYISYSFALAMPGDIVSYFTCLLVSTIMYLSYAFLNSFHNQFVNRKKLFS